ncbi:hypothetical protein [Wolbachia endosymbiont (group A) of Gastracanthus pulcherrimus]
MNLLYVTYYPKSDATKPSQCLGTGMTASLTTVIPLLVSGI